jgi:hypothetical protein
MARGYIEDVSGTGEQVRLYGLKTGKAVDFSNAVSVALPAATTIAGTTAAGTSTITSTSANALTVGRQGATNPVLKVDASAATVVTGLSVTGAAVASGVAVAAISSGTNENLTVDAKGSGTITLNGTGTGNIVLGRAATGVSLSVTGALIANSGTAVPASAGAVAAGAPVTLFSSGPSLYVTSDVPAFSAVKGSICVNTAGSSTSTRLYVNNGTTNWVAITTAS